MACLEIPKGAGSSTVSTVWVSTGGSDKKFILCHLQNEPGGLNCPIQQEFGVDDGPLKLFTSAGIVHITGRWCPLDGEDEGEDEAETLCQVVTEAPKPTGKKKRETKEPQAVVAGASSKRAKKAEDEELLALAAMMAPANVEAPSSDATAQLKKRKRWKVVPQGDEGVTVPEPKQRTLPSGVLATDYIVGKGVEPKLGTKLKIVYEGSFPDGTVFDSRLKRSKPFVFRKGAADVIRGLDLGMEGMRAGGAREIVIPPALGSVFFPLFSLSLLSLFSSLGGAR
jgi:FKBP-type peptidyl-prolyl cis-trans isomerase